MTDLRERTPAQALMEKLDSLRGTPDLVQLPLGIVKISKDGLNWLRGFRGELEMARQLRALGPDWTVLHSVPVGNRESDIDHVVIGPAGVFPINTKRLVDARVWVAGGRFLVNGRTRDYLRNSEFEAARVDRVLAAAGIPLRAIPVIAISSAKSLTVRGTPVWNGRSIGVVGVGSVVRRIRKRQFRLTPAQVHSVVAALSDSSAWTGRPRTAEYETDVQASYERINRGVTRWNLLVAAAGIAFAVIVTIVAAAVSSALR